MATSDLVRAGEAHVRAVQEGPVGGDLEAGGGLPADYAWHKDAPRRGLFGEPFLKVPNESLSILAFDARRFAANIVFNEIEQLGLNIRIDGAALHGGKAV